MSNFHFLVIPNVADTADYRKPWVWSQDERIHAAVRLVTLRWMHCQESTIRMEQLGGMECSVTSSPTSTSNICVEESLFLVFLISQFRTIDQQDGIYGLFYKWAHRGYRCKKCKYLWYKKITLDRGICQVTCYLLYSLRPTKASKSSLEGG